MIEGGALIDTIAAPGPGQAKDGHPALERAEPFHLIGGEGDPPVHGVPTSAMLIGRVAIEKLVVR